MKKIISILVISLTASTVFADPAGWQPNNMGVPTNNMTQYYHVDHHNRYNHRHRNKKDSDDAAWAIGGLLLGVILADSYNKDKQPEYSQPLPPPQKRKVVTCSDEVAYDENNNPYVKRSCYEIWQ